MRLSGILRGGLGVVVAVLAAARILQSSALDRTPAARLLAKAADLLMFGVAVLFVVWFRRARISAERSSTCASRSRSS